MDTGNFPRDRRLNTGRYTISYDDDDDDEQLQINPATVWRLATSAVCGLVFGFTAEKCKVYHPSIIQDQMLFHRFILLKVVLSAISTGMFCLCVMSMIPTSSDTVHRFRQRYLLQCYNKGAVTNIVGTVMLAVGMGISGMTPSLVMVQLGARTETAVYGIVGCLLGALLMGAVLSFYPILKSSHQNVKHFQPESTPYFTHALPVAAILSIAVFALELWISWETELDANLQDGENTHWSPYSSGIIIGLLIIPQVLTLSQPLAGSAGFCTVTSQILVTRWTQRKLSQLSRHQRGISNWLQQEQGILSRSCYQLLDHSTLVVFLGCCAMGAIISSSISSSNIITQSDVAPLSVFIGGVLVTFGAQLSSGSTMLIQNIL